MLHLCKYVLVLMQLNNVPESRSKTFYKNGSLESIPSHRLCSNNHNLLQSPTLGVHHQHTWWCN